MSNLLRNILAILAGIVVGGSVNMSLITLSPFIIPPPAGVDVNDAASLAKFMHLFQPQHFIMPFLAHALGTLAGAITAYLIACTGKARIACAIGVVFLFGGVAACFMIPAPAWFMTLDLLVAYLPMAWLGIRIAEQITAGSHRTGNKVA